MRAQSGRLDSIASAVPFIQNAIDADWVNEAIPTKMNSA
jgi:hypothetical protein